MSNIKVKQQKIIKVGNSYAVTLDKKFVDANNLKVGEPIGAYYTQDAQSVEFKQMTLHKKPSLNKTKKDLASKITPELRQWVDNFIRENREALEALAKA